MESIEAISTLRAHFLDLPAKDQEFASSLLKSANRGASEKQMYWIKKLALKATGVAIDAPTVATDMSGIVSLMHKAGTKLKYPKIALQTKHGHPVKLAVAGERSKTPGAVNVTDGGDWGLNTFYGRIDTAGKWHGNDRADVARLKEITDCLVSLSSDPAGIAGTYGKKTGCCCFCTHVLSDPKSTAVGYGPVCAKNYDLPH